MAIIAGFMVPHPPMIVPEVGRGSERTVQETAESYRKVARQIAALKPDTILISTPHSVMYADYFHISPGRGAKGSFASFGAGDVKMEVAYDGEFIEALCTEASICDLSAGTMGERDKALDHGTMVPLYFILQEYTDFQLVRLSLSGLPMEEHYRLGQAIQTVSETLGRRTVFVASGDLSHKLKEDGPYGLNPAGPVYDERIMDVMGRAAFGELFDFDEHFLEKAAECGHRSFVIMAGAFDQRAIKPERFSHQDVTGVGYGICSFYPEKGEDGSDLIDPERAFLQKREAAEKERLGEAKKKEDLYVRLARLSLESYVKERKTVDWRIEKDALAEGYEKDGAQDASTAVDSLSNTRAGAFVSLHKQGQLRGCIGTIGPVADCLADEIIANAISAAMHDSRFLPVSADELDKIEYSVDVLSPAEHIDDESMLDVKRYGVIVTKGGRRGLLLPNLDGVDTIEQQLSIAKRKAGLSPNESGCSLERFEVVRHT